MNHYLKIWPEPFAAIVDGRKRFEVRRDDRGYAVGDVLYLREWVPERADYTGRVQTRTVCYIARGWGLPAGMVVMGLDDGPRTDCPLCLTDGLDQCICEIAREAPAPVDLDAEACARLHAAGIDVAAEHVRMLQDTVARLGAEAQSLRENGDRLAREVYASRHDTEAALLKLAEAKRLGLEACEFIHSAISNAPDANSTDLGDMSASAMGHNNADRIAAALEKL